MVPEGLLSALFRFRDQLAGLCGAVAAGADALRPRVRHGLLVMGRVKRLGVWRGRLARPMSEARTHAAARVMLDAYPLLLRP